MGLIMCMFTFLPSSPFPQIQAVTRVSVGEFSQPIPLTIEGSYNRGKLTPYRQPT